MWLHDGPDPAWPAKARVLAEAAVAGLPVPRGVVLPLHEPLAAPVMSALSRLVTGGTVIARTALVGEDEAQGSAAGLGESRAGLRSLPDVVEAIADLRTRRDDPFLEFYRGAPSDADAVILQREVPRHRLVVGALLPRGVDYIEVHDGEGDVLAQGASPRFAGPRPGWEGDGSAALQALVQRIRSKFELGEHGVDIEVVVDDAGAAHLVQLRPLAVPLDEAGEAFIRAVEAAGQADRMQGTLTLDAEHNPAPLSPAHAGLMQWLAQHRPAAGRPTVLAGWLYVRTLVRDLAKAAPAPPPEPGAVRAVRTLHGELIPAARRRLGAIDAQLGSAEAAALPDLLARAHDAFAEMIDVYLGVLVPARAAAGRPDLARPDAPLTTRGREAFVDVLPAAWDIASPVLADLLELDPPGGEAPLPDDEAEAAVLLTEWDDHLFALGLAPVRRVFVRAGSLLGIGDAVFLLSADELVNALQHGVRAELLASRRRAQAGFAALRPPLRIEDGYPTPVLRHARLRGLPMGPSVEGPIAPRRDLAHLLRSPPPTGAIVVLPALTAQAAVALEQLGVTAVCCEYGGAMSHAALMARELRLSALIGCRDCTRVPAGVRARLDTVLGRLLVEELDPADPAADPEPDSL